jgi:hypothetical protein
MFDEIEKLKRDLTDKFVVVDATMPELMRFEGHVGQVKTINMNGRALVQFEAWNNIGWYDIELDFLKVVPKPEAATEGKKHEPAAAPKAAAKPATPAAAAGEKKLSPLEMARMQGAAKGATAKPASEKAPAPAAEKVAPASAGAKKSTADILAAARANKVSAAEGAPAAPTVKPKLNTADILAAARAIQAAPPAEPPPAAAAPKPAVEPPPAVAPKPAPPQAAVVAPKPAPSAPAAAPGQRPTISEILAWCRQHDAK